EADGRRASRRRGVAPRRRRSRPEGREVSRLAHPGRTAWSDPRARTRLHFRRERGELALHFPPSRLTRPFPQPPDFGTLTPPNGGTTGHGEGEGEGRRDGGRGEVEEAGEGRLEGEGEA